MKSGADVPKQKLKHYLIDTNIILIHTYVFMNINVMNVYNRLKREKTKKAFYPIRSRLIYSMGLVNAICGIEVILS